MSEDKEKKKKKKVNKTKWVIIFLIIIMILSTIIPMTAMAYEWDGEHFAYGAGLTEEQIKETENILGIEGSTKRYSVSAEDFYKYTGLTTNDSILLSSVTIKRKSEGKGVSVRIATPENITKVEPHQYMNAALTSGLKDAEVVIASPVEVTGESALVGIYKALEETGVEVDRDAAALSSEEISVVGKINEETGDFASEELSLAIAEIKEELANIEDRSNLTREEVGEIVDEKLLKNNIILSENSRNSLVELMDKFKSLNIDWDSIKGQLDNFKKDLKDKIKGLYELGNESGFFEKISSFFKRMLEALKQIFQ